MFCEKCGQNNADDAKFCENCGAELQAPAEVVETVEEVEAVETIEEVEAVETVEAADAVETVDTVEEDVVAEAPVETEESGMGVLDAVPESVRKFIPAIISAGAVILLVIILLASGIFKSGSLKAVEKSMKATIKGDGKAVFELTMHPYALEEAIEDEEFEDKAEAIDEYKDRAEDVRDSLEDAYGKGLRVKVEHKKTTKYKKSDIKKINEYLEEEHDYPANYISALHVVKVKATIKGREDDDSETSEVVVAKVKGKWYMGEFPGLYSKSSIKDVIKGDD